MSGFRDAGLQRPINRRLGEVLGGLGISTGGNTAGTTGTVLGPAVLVGLGGLSLSQSTQGNRATISMSVAVESGIGLAAGTQTATSGIVNLSNSNGITFGLSASTVTASHNGVSQLAVADSAGTGVNLGIPRLQFATSVGANVSFGKSVNANTFIVTANVAAVNLAAGTQTATSGTAILSNSNGVSFGMNGSSQITASVSPQISVQIQDATGTVNFNLTGGAITFVNNASGAKFGSSALGGGSVGISAKTISTVSYLVNNGYDRGVFVGGISVGTLHLAPLRADNFISATRMDMIWDVNNVSSAGATVTQIVGLYTMSGSTIGTVSTGSRSWAYNSTAAQSSYTQISGTRYRSMSLAGGTWFVTPGDYILGAMFTISTSQSSGTHRVMGGRDISVIAAEYPLALGSAVPYWNGGFYSVTTGAFPATIQLSEMVITGADDIIWVPFVTLAGTF